jgi:hypothetical protein
VEALGRAAWPELWPIIDDLLATEKSEEILAEARVLRDVYEKRVPRPG